MPYPFAAFAFKSVTFLMILLMILISIASFGVLALRIAHKPLLDSFQLPPILVSYLTLEALFLSFTWMDCRYHLSFPSPARAGSSFDEKRAADFIREFKQPHFKKSEFINGWFMGQTGITRCDVEELMAGMFFNKSTILDLDEKETELMRECIDVAEQEGGFDWKRREKGDKALNMIRLGVDDHTLLPRPLLFYIPVWIVSHLFYFYIGQQGFLKTTLKKGLDCYHRPPTIRNASQPKPAIILLHGLGIGLPVYTSFIKSLHTTFPDSDILLP